MKELKDADNYKQVLDKALEDIQQELLLLVDNKKFLVYIHSVTCNNNEIDINWSTPHKDDEINKDELFVHVQNAITAQIKEGIKCQQSPTQYSSILSTMTNIFVKYSPFLVLIISIAALIGFALNS